MREGLGQAISDLRREMNWLQPDLAKAMHQAAKKRIGRPVTRNMISDWENGKWSPSAEYRSALAMVAMRCSAQHSTGSTKKRLDDLTILFSATLDSWRFLGAVKRREAARG